MRTRNRLLVGFVAAHLLLSVVLGVVAWTWIDDVRRDQAETSARAIGKVLAEGRFPLTDEVREKMSTLTGHEFRALDRAQPAVPGTVQIAEGGRVIEVRYDTPAYARARRDVLLATLAVILSGSALFGLVAVWLAGQFARPLERLAWAARVIGSGDLDAAVPAVGSGELGALAAELEQMRARLRELDRQHRQDERLATLGTFTATIAHEVRNPLSAVRLTVQMLARRHPDDAGLTMITAEIERLDLIVDELLGFSTGMTVRAEPCALRPLAEGIALLLRRQAEHAGVAISVQGDATVHADPARLRQLLMNLVLNAIQAQHGAGAVRIELLPDGVAVSDDGPGVVAELLPHLFEAFTSGKPGGTGLGLHLAKAVAEAHGATLRYDPRPRGARFVVSGLSAVDAG